MRLTVLVASFALLCASPGFAQDVKLSGADGQSATLSAAQLAGMSRVTVAFDAHGESHTYEGALLSDMLARVGTPFGAALRGPALASVVLVKAADGYQVAFGLTEADPAIQPNRIILADRADGQPLSGSDGPFKLVVEGDLRPVRGVRRVTEISVVALAAVRGTAATGAAAPPHQP